jgi:hypothetical protein
MANTFSETIRGWFQSIANLFRPKQGLDSMSKDDLLAQKMQLERNENKILRQMKQLEAQKAKLFEEAKQEPSESMRRAKARQIRDIDQRIKGLQAVLGPLGQRIGVMDRLISQYEMGQFAKGSSELVDVLRETDAQVIQQQLDEALTEDILHDEKVGDMLDTFRASAEREAEQYEEDEDLLAILGEIEHAANLDAAAEESAILRAEKPFAQTEQPMKE